MAFTQMLRVMKLVGGALPFEAWARLRRWGPARSLKAALEARDLPREIAMPSDVVWRRLRDCPAAVLDAGGAQIGNLLHVICGMSSPSTMSRSSPSTVSRSIHVFDLRRERWTARHEVPEDLAHSHHGVATDGERYIYIAAGQLGAQCRPAVATTYCFDSATGAWRRLPPLPAPRYAGSMQLWRGRLHFVGGAAEDRWTPTNDHWSLGVRGSEAREPEWRTEAPAPVAAMHRGACVVGDRLYLFGGQQGDFVPIPGDPDYTCTRHTRENYLASAFRLSNPGGAWERLADMPIPGSHWDSSTVVLGDRVLLVGGQVYKHPEKSYLKLTNAIQAYDLRADKWSIAGHAPCHLKTPVTGRIGDALVIICGQRGHRREDRPGPIVAHAWKAELPDFSRVASEPPLPCVKGRRALLVAHELGRTGAPLELLELAEAMIASGAAVRVASMKESANGADLAAAYRVPLVPAETALEHALDSDIIVANTAAEPTKAWVRACLDRSPVLASRLVWLIHEIDTAHYGEDMEDLDRAKVAIFDSRACLDAWREVGRGPRDARTIHPGVADSLAELARRSAHPFRPAGAGALRGASGPLSRAQTRARLGIGPEEVLVLSVGSYSMAKGQDMLLRTVAETARARNLPLKLLLVGFADERQRRAFLKGLSADARRVIGPRTAFVSTPHLPALYQAGDIHVLNSQGLTGRGETFGRATVEAMAFGLPALGTDAGGTREIIRDGVDGFLYPLGEAGQVVLAERLTELAADVGKRRAMGAAAKDRVERRFRKCRYLREMDDALSVVLGLPLD